MKGKLKWSEIKTKKDKKPSDVKKSKYADKQLKKIRISCYSNFKKELFQGRNNHFIIPSLLKQFNNK